MICRVYPNINPPDRPWAVAIGDGDTPIPVYGFHLDMETTAHTVTDTTGAQPCSWIRVNCSEAIIDQDWAVFTRPKE